MKMREEIENNIKMLLEIAEKLELDVDGNTLLEIAVKLFQDEEIRKSRSGYMPKEQTEGKSSEEKATEKQIFMLNKLGIEYPENITKIEASKLISENIEKKKTKY